VQTLRVLAFALLASFVPAIVFPLAAAELDVPAFTAYMIPNPEAARISPRGGVTRWTDPTQTVNWFGLIRSNGTLTARLVLRLPADAESKLELSVAGKPRAVVVRGAGPDVPVTADFGSFEVPKAGYQRFALKSLNEAGRPFGDLETLRLGGPAMEGAHFNLEERRNAASVHLMYPLPKDTNAMAFYCEVTAVADPTATFYMACGWHRGYFGMQVNSPTERRIIFSVWDSGNEGVDRAKVADADRVQLVGKGEGVFTGDFGNEGTGGHSHLKYGWKTRETQRFLVTAQPTNTTFTIFSGYYFHPENKAWMLISSWKAPKEGGGLRGLHSFSENFWGSNGHMVRKAFYGNQWARLAGGKWLELTVATFSHDPTGKAARLDRTMGVTFDRFFLRHGGFLEDSVPYGERFMRPQHRSTPGRPRRPPPALPPGTTDGRGSVRDSPESEINRKPFLVIAAASPRVPIRISLLKMPHHRLRPGPNPVLGKNPLEVAVHGPHADPQFPTHFLVGESPRQQIQNLQFP
jgi:hypothetical protein